MGPDYSFLYWDKKNSEAYILHRHVYLMILKQHDISLFSGISNCLCGRSAMFGYNKMTVLLLSVCEFAMCFTTTVLGIPENIL